MSKRKTVRWIAVAAFALFILSQVPCMAGFVCFVVGGRFQSVGNYQAAVGAYNGAVFLYPRFARGYIELGTSYLALKKYQQAETAFLKARSIRDDSCASCGLGMAYHKLERYNDAEKAFQHAISLDADDVCPYEQAGRMYYDLNRYEAAIESFKHVMALRPNFNAYMFLGHSYVYAREYEQGIDAYKKALELNPNDASAHVQLGIAYDYSARYEEAVDEYKQAIKLNPDDEKAHRCLAEAYLALHDRPAALAEFEIMRKLNPKSSASEELASWQGRETGKEKLYFIPLNNFSTSSLTKLVTYYKEKKNIEAIPTQPLPLRLAAIDNRRQQIVAEEVIELVKRSYPKLAGDPNAILIALTDQDMYIREQQNWRFAFSYRAEGRFGVVSCARMNPVNLGDPANEALLDSRMRKMVLKNIGILYYQYPSNRDPKSVLYRDVLGLDDLDKMGEDF